MGAPLFTSSLRKRLDEGVDEGGSALHFHNEGKPTAAICHGPIALLSGQSNPQAFELALKTTLCYF